MSSTVKGFSMCNPVVLDRDYLLFTADYAIEKGYNHFQMIGPTHDPVKGNIDGMIFYRKYAQFNGDKDEQYVRFCEQLVNEVCDKLAPKGIKTYFWHHELEVPAGFQEAYPEICNDYGDVEITHPIIKDFLENKIEDWFATYPKMDGIILTLHETRIPLLKLKNQKLDKIGRVQYVTKILFDKCKELGKELIVRPFASIEEDYELMTKAYAQISPELIVMDKWTQFDWSLTLPNNAFFKKITGNPLMIETDIFGEYFGKGFLPLLLKDHMIEKYAYCQSFSPVGYVSRIDREGYHPFGNVNEVNLEIMQALENGRDVDSAIEGFFAKRYGAAGACVREIMEGTEDIQKKIFYANGYYFTELSRFPRLNHCKNHFYIEMMKENYCIASDEWFIPIGWQRGTLAHLQEEKASAVKKTQEKLTKLESLKDLLSPDDFNALQTQFYNLHYVAKLWQSLTETFIAYAKYFETKEEKYETDLENALRSLTEINAEASAKLGKKYYPTAIGKHFDLGANLDAADFFVSEVQKSFAEEKLATARLEKENLTDFIVCGGGNEGHKLKKEVNFSDTYLKEDGICRIPGTNRGKAFSTVNAHGWFSYEMKTRKGEETTLAVIAAGTDGHIDFDLTIGERKYEVRELGTGKEEFRFTFLAADETARVRIDRVSAYTPYVYELKVF